MKFLCVKHFVVNSHRLRVNEHFATLILMKGALRLCPRFSKSSKGCDEASEAMNCFHNYYTTPTCTVGNTTSVGGPVPFSSQKRNFGNIIVNWNPQRGTTSRQHQPSERSRVRVMISQHLPRIYVCATGWLSLRVKTCWRAYMTLRKFPKIVFTTALW
jgi:hypothetical protein